MKLWEYEGKQVKITDTDGQVFIGFYNHYVSELDDPDGVGYLALDPDNRSGVLINITKNEIVDIEVIQPNFSVIEKVINL